MILVASIAGVNVIGRRSSILERDQTRLKEWTEQFRGQPVHGKLPLCLFEHPYACFLCACRVMTGNNSRFILRNETIVALTEISFSYQAIYTDLMCYNCKILSISCRKKRLRMSHPVKLDNTSRKIAIRVL